MFSYYLRLAWNSLRRTPILSGLMVLALGLGIGAFMTTFTVYYVMSGDPIPQKSDKLFAVQLDNWDPNDPPTESARDVEPQVTYQDGQNLLNADTPATRQAHMYSSFAIVVPEDDKPPFSQTIRATSYTFFEMFDVPFMYGQPWAQQADDERASVVVIGEDLNDRLFDGENSVGKSIRVGDALFEIVGVIKHWQPIPRFYHADWSRKFDDVEGIFMPFGRALEVPFPPTGNTNCWKPMDDSLPVLQAFLQSECVWSQFWAEIDTPEQEAAYKDYLDNYVREQKKVGRFERPLNTFLSDVNEFMDIQGVVGNDNRVLVRLSFLFLLVCVLNTVGLLMAKFLGKSGDVALRRAMGASRTAVFQQNLVEVGLVGVLGGLLGIGLALLGLQGIGKLYRDYEHLVYMDLPMLLTAVAMATTAAILAGLYPVWRVSRLAPAGLLKTQ